MTAQLPDISDEEKKKLVKAATAIINTLGRQRAVSYLIVTFTENAKLVKEVNRLRTLVNEELLPTYSPE